VRAELNDMRIGRRLVNLLKVLAVFVLLGPPIGTLTFFAGMGVYGAGQTGSLSDLMWIILFGLIYAVPLSYLIGIIPAGIAGIILGTVAVLYRTPGTLLSMATGLMVGFGLVYSGGGPTLPDTVESASDYAPTLLLVSTCLVATVVCWAVARRSIGRVASP